MMRGGLLFIFLLSSISYGQILVDEPSQDLGDVYENRGKITAKFILKNPYQDDTIRIHDINTSCGCTAILSDDTLIMPRSSIELKFSYDPKGRSGLFSKSIEVVSRIGIYDQHRFFLKISGNVVSENMAVKNVNAELIEYLVAPISYYAITPYDTSYLDFNFFISFVNDLTYEIDFYQFTTIGFEVGVKDYEDIEQLEYLLFYTHGKIQREFRMRGYDPNTVIFDDPVFVENNDLPLWSKASIKVYSVNFGSDLIQESVIKLTDDEVVENKDLMLNYERFSRPSTEEVIEQVNFEGLEAKLFSRGSLDLQGVVLSPKRMSYHDRVKFGEQLEKLIFTHLKKSSGISKKEVNVQFDSLGIHPTDKFKFMLWDKADEEELQKFSYEVKPDRITPPLLPTYRQSTLLTTDIDLENEGFKYFWKNIMLNHKAGRTIKILVESSKSHIPRGGEENTLLLANQDGLKIKEALQDMFLKETGRELEVVVEGYVHGPEYNWHNKRHAEYSQYEYFNLIPLVNQQNGTNEFSTNPYLVNFDYYFNGIDTASWVFSKFANYIAEEIHQNGYVHLIIESSISRIQLEKNKTNIFIAYERALESEYRLKDYLKRKLVDPNRIIFTEERFLMQGPAYDGTIPIVKFRKFQYLKIIPEKHLLK